MIANPACPVGPRGRKTERMLPPVGRPWTISLARYMVKIINARVSPTVHMKVETTSVLKAYVSEYWSSALAMIAPLVAPTMRVTTGNSHMAVMELIECF